MTKRESMDFDVVIVGGGPAGLSAAIRLAQLSKEQPLSICILEKGAEIGAHILSGAVLEPRALDELIPNWQQKNPPAYTAVNHDQFVFLTEKKSWRLPTPPQMKNEANVIISLGLLCKWLAQHAEALGVNIFPGFAATDILYEQDKVCGIITGDKGVDKLGQAKSNYQAGIELHAKQVIFAEGCRGSLSEKIIKKYHLTQHCDPQTYGLGIKELWQIPKAKHQSGSVMHSIGWPLDQHTYGGSFIYQFADNMLSIGFVVGLDYRNPYLNPYEEFQRFKTHPSIYPLLQAGKRLAYGARSLVEGGLQSLPKLSVPGGLLIGDAAGFLNVPKIKGIHTAMKSGMLAAESLFKQLRFSSSSECEDYAKQIKTSWLGKELYQARNIRPALRFGLGLGLLYAAIDTYLLRGKAPWTLHHTLSDHQSLHEAKYAKPIAYPKHDQQVTFDITDSLYLSHLHYGDDHQPPHLLLKNSADAININLKRYASPETRYCPAAVYNIVQDENNEPKLHINYGNCLQCKACDIKDPEQNIVWTPPEGGCGPNYDMM